MVSSITKAVRFRPVVYLAGLAGIYFLYVLVAAVLYQFAWDSRAARVNAAAHMLIQPSGEKANETLPSMAVPSIPELLSPGGATVLFLPAGVSGKGYCEPQKASRFTGWIPAYASYATYDTYARWVELCLHNVSASVSREPANPKTMSEAAVAPSVQSESSGGIKLCSGTRKLLGGSTCKQSMDFVKRLYGGDDAEGSVETMALLLLGLTVGTFQLVSLLAVGWAVIRTYYLSKDVTAPWSTENPSIGANAASSPTPTREEKARPDNHWSSRYAAQQAVAKVHANPNQSQALHRFLLEKEHYSSRVESRFRELETVEESVVLVGFLGTLWGLASLFSSIGKSISANPIISEVAKSELFGAMGVAFGTTLFAVILKMGYQTYLARRKADVLSRIDEDFLDQAAGLDVSVDLGKIAKNHFMISQLGRNALQRELGYLDDRPVVQQSTGALRLVAVLLLAIIAMIFAMRSGNSISAEQLPPSRELPSDRAAEE